MTWTRLSDDYAERVCDLGLSRSARLLDVEALIYCNRRVNDGVLPRTALVRVTDSANPMADFAQLVTAGLWSETETGWQLDWSRPGAGREGERTA